MKKKAARIYIVDDDASIRSSLSRLLKASGFNVRSFASAADFLAEAPGERDSCMLLDISMPTMSGLQLLKRLELSGSELPVILITAHEDKYLELTDQSSALACLHKPLQEEETLAMIDQGLARWNSED